MVAAPKKTDSVVEYIESEIVDAESSLADYEISTYPADFTLEVLCDKLKNKEIIVPQFQRKFVWTQAQASRLIESFLLGLPVPAIYLYTEKDTENLLIIDGQQRLKSVFYYFEGYFGEETKGRRPVFRLTGLNEKSRWFNKSYKDLESTDEPSARRLRNQVLRSFIVKQLDPKDDTSVYHIFERLNTGGTFLTGQEIRNCVYHGAFNELLMELNALPSWRAIFGRNSVDNRMRDVELILRFLALSEELSKYEKPMKDFLNSFMSRNRNARASTLERFRERFTRVSSSVNELLGSKPFHVRQGLNASTYDAVFVALARKPDAIPTNLKDRFDALITSEAFVDATTSSTTDVNVVKSRVRLASQALTA